MKKILLLDDNLDILQVVEEALTYEHFDVKATTRSAHLLQLAEQFKPDLIILDYRLADGNSGELCRAIKAHPALRHIPVVIFSAYVQPGLDFKAFGSDEVIEKPFDLDLLLQTVQRLTGMEKDIDIEAQTR